MNLILANSWETIVNNSNRGDIIFAAVEGIPELFQWIHKQNREYTVVSGYSDFGICKQKEFHSNSDLAKIFAVTDFNYINDKQDAYFELPPVRSQYCDTRHEYSIKMDRYTLGTFNAEHVPQNIKHWFTVNLNCWLPKTSLLPFGMNEQGHGHEVIQNYFLSPQNAPYNLYVNFQDHTADRKTAKQFFRGKDFATVVDKPNMDYHSYAWQLQEHKFVLCMPGNGFDCYRTYEAVWTGCICVCPNIPLYQQLRSYGFPIVTFDKFEDITQEFLDKALAFYKNFDWQSEVLFLDYWVKQILGE